jgi:hypothetical protein
MTANVNSNQHPDKLKDQHHDWVKGFTVKGKVMYHPYTKKNFKFDSGI